MDTFADSGQLARRVKRDLTTTEGALAEDLLEEASETLRELVPSLDSRIADGTLSPALPRGVVLRMVHDALTSPGGATLVEQLGDTSYTYDRQALRELMSPTPVEIARLSARSTRSSVGVARTRPLL